MRGIMSLGSASKRQSGVWPARWKGCALWDVERCADHNCWHAAFSIVVLSSPRRLPITGDGEREAVATSVAMRTARSSALR